MKTILFYLMIPFYYLYYLWTRQAFIVSGTFIDKEGTRMFCRSIFTTSFDRMPLHDLEVKMGKQFGVDKVLIIFFTEIPWRQAKYIEQPSPGTKIEMAPLSKSELI